MYIGLLSLERSERGICRDAIAVVERVIALPIDLGLLGCCPGTLPNRADVNPLAERISKVPAPIILSAIDDPNPGQGAVRPPEPMLFRIEDGEVYEMFGSQGEVCELAGRSRTDRAGFERRTVGVRGMRCVTLSEDEASLGAGGNSQVGSEIDYRSAAQNADIVLCLGHWEAYAEPTGWLPGMPGSRSNTVWLAVNAMSPAAAGHHQSRRELFRRFSDGCDQSDSVCEITSDEPRFRLGIVEV